MTDFGLYLVIIYIIGVASTLYYASKGGVTHTRNTLLASAVWSVFNVVGIILWGTGTGI